MNIEDYQSVLLDCIPDAMTMGLTVGDLDMDGNTEFVVSTISEIKWYRPCDGKSGTIAKIEGVVGLTMHDINGDGLPEVVSGVLIDGVNQLVWFERSGDGWVMHVIDPDPGGHVHDIQFADIFLDGSVACIANAVYCPVPSLYLYKPGQDPRKPWVRKTIQKGQFEEGLAVIDLNGNGRLDIASGTHVYLSPSDPMEEPWTQTRSSLDLREMVRVTTSDITGNGLPDLILVESEYPDGRLHWIENCLDADAPPYFKEHYIDRGYNFAHSLGILNNEDGTTFFVGEMARGGWGAPYNHDARLTGFSSKDGKDWKSFSIHKGLGTHQATPVKLPEFDQPVIAGKDHPFGRVQIYRPRIENSPTLKWRHEFIDRDRPEGATDITALRLTESEELCVASGRYWYERDGNKWIRREIPGIHQIHAAYDIDGDGREELVATKKRQGDHDWYGSLCSELVWLKPVDAREGKWEEYEIGSGSGDWVHSTAFGPVMKDGEMALITGYHNAKDGAFPEMFVLPEDPKKGPWKKQTLAEINYGEEMILFDINGNGLSDVVAGTSWLENKGDGSFVVHEMCPNFPVARVQVQWVDGKPVIVLGTENLDFNKNVAPHSPVTLLTPSDEGVDKPWIKKCLDQLRCAHSIAFQDFDGDGVPEIIIGEHDPFKDYRSHCHLFYYRKDPVYPNAYERTLIDDRFEHHDGCRVFRLRPDGPLCFLSIGWKEGLYVHLYVPEDRD